MSADRDDVWAVLFEIMEAHYAGIYIHGGGEEECEADLKEACAEFTRRLRAESLRLLTGRHGSE